MRASDAVEELLSVQRAVIQHAKCDKARTVPRVASQRRVRISHLACATSERLPQQEVHDPAPLARAGHELLRIQIEAQVDADQADAL